MSVINRGKVCRSSVMRTGYTFRIEIKKKRIVGEMKLWSVWCVDGMCGEGWGGGGDSSVVFRKLMTTIRSDKTLLNFEFQKFGRRVR